jgi:hypothetical protein
MVQPNEGEFDFFPLIAALQLAGTPKNKKVSLCRQENRGFEFSAR